MNVRRAGSGDIEGLIGLHEQLDRQMMRISRRLWTRGVDPAPGYEEYLNSDAVRLFVAEHEGELVGYLAGRVEVREQAAPRVVGFVMRAFVREQWRGRGVGTARFKALLGFFESRGVEDISLRYIVGNQEGERFWRHLGFEPVICTANARPDELRRRLQQMAGG